MPIATFFKEKQKEFKSQYHQVSKQVESKYELLNWKIISRFHIKATETELVRSEMNNLIKNSTESMQYKIKTKTKSPLISITYPQKQDYLYHENIDWTRGRFSGQVIKIIVREGKIIEKVFLTPKRNCISVKRCQLGLWC